MSTFRDPIIYPGAPMPPKAWATAYPRKCALGAHAIEKGTTVQAISQGMVACVPHAEEWEAAA